MIDLIPTRFKLLNLFLVKKNIKILDVGCGSNSPSITKRWFPSCEYHGIDKEKNYQNNEKDILMIDRFYEIDVRMLDFTMIPDNYFDVVIMSHIIEHLPNGDEVIRSLLAKLTAGGLIYIEFPSRKSLSLPSMRGTLNFYDDKTHCRVFTRDEIEELLKAKSFKIMYSHVRRDWTRIVFMPLLMVNSLIKYGYIAGSVFWDITGFAEIVIARKP